MKARSTLSSFPCFPCPHSRARHVKGAGGALAVGVELVEFPRMHRTPTSSVRPSGHLTVGLLGLSQAFNAAVRKILHFFYCRECVLALANHL